MLAPKTFLHKRFLALLGLKGPIGITTQVPEQALGRFCGAGLCEAWRHLTANNTEWLLNV